MYRIQCRETGDVIERCETLRRAEEIVESYERKDMEEGDYTPDFYEIKEESSDKMTVTESKQLLFNVPVTFDDIYDNTTDIIMKMYPTSADLIEAMNDQMYDELCIDFRAYFIELAKERGMYIEKEE